MKSVLREPLLHFFLLGAAIFGLYAALSDAATPATENRLVLTNEHARRLAAEFEAVWRRPPTAEELDHLIDAFVREEIYVREALALGLDADDAVIRRRLQAKMEFLTESGALAAEPDDATLQAHLDTHRDRFREAPLIGFEQVMLDEGLSEDRLAAILAGLNAGQDPVGGTRASLLPPAFPPSPAQVVDGTLGTGFFDRLAPLPVGRWAGPVPSPYGAHLVRVTERRAGRLPGLDEIRERVEQDWRAAFVADLRDERYRALRARYQVVRPESADVLAR